ncbi:MAG: family transposase [Phycisphaerales bacterium]|nr:family transposase [Phycisphaerales bacterium]
MEHVRGTLAQGRVSKRRACSVLGYGRATQRRQAVVPGDDPKLMARMVERSFAWMTRFRRLAKDYERLPQTVARVHFAEFALAMPARIFGSIQSA